jgi:hypothetical protein
MFRSDLFTGKITWVFIVENSMIKFNFQTKYFFSIFFRGKIPNNKRLQRPTGGEGEEGGLALGQGTGPGTGFLPQQFSSAFQQQDGAHKLYNRRRNRPVRAGVGSGGGPPRYPQFNSSPDIHNLNTFFQHDNHDILDGGGGGLLFPYEAGGNFLADNINNQFEGNFNSNNNNNEGKYGGNYGFNSSPDYPESGFKPAGPPLGGGRRPYSGFRRRPNGPQRPGSAFGGAGNSDSSELFGNFEVDLTGGRPLGGGGRPARAGNRPRRNGGILGLFSALLQ